MVMRSAEFPSVAPSAVSRPHHHTFVGASAVQGGAFFSPNQVRRVESQPHLTETSPAYQFCSMWLTWLRDQRLVGVLLVTLGLS